MNYDPKVHRRQSIRLKRYDYSQQGAYFITICAHEKKCLFGKIINNEMVLNQFGMIVYKEWMKSSSIRSEIELDHVVVMPNHLHGIVFIREQTNQREQIFPPSTGLTSLKTRSIPSLIAGYKSTVTRKINQIRMMPGVPVWQRNYDEHIIRSEESLEKIREYVIYNPHTWKRINYLVKYDRCAA